jgi:hypothetical protein
MILCYMTIAIAALPAMAQGVDKVDTLPSKAS